MTTQSEEVKIEKQEEDPKIEEMHKWEYFLDSRKALFLQTTRDSSTLAVPWPVHPHDHSYTEQRWKRKDD